MHATRFRLGFGSLPALGLLVACATAVDQGFVDDDTPSAGGKQAGLGGSNSSSGSTSVAGKSPGSGGKAPSAFGGSSSGTATGGSNGGHSGSGAGGSAGTESGGGSAGMATAGSGGTSAGTAGSGGSTAGTGGSGGSTAGSGGSGGSSPSTGECAPESSGWVVQYWTNTPPGNMPAGDLRIFNNSGASVNFSALELRHYFTNEETATLTFTFSTFGHNFPADPYYQDENGTNVQSSILAVAPPVTNASHYIRIAFNATPGSFGPNENAQLGFYGSVSMYPFKSNQANDYTYVGHPTNDPGSANKTVGWDHITLYKDGALVWGCEP